MLTPVLIAVVVLSVVVVFIWTYGTTHSRMWSAQLIEEPAVSGPMAAACDDLRRSLAHVAPPLSDHPAHVVASMAAQDAAVATMIARDREIGQETLAGDPPALDWLADWEALLRARHEAERTLLGSQGDRQVTVVLPTVDGYPITGRMADALPACAVPRALLELPRPRE
ncbi:hypothetical protein I6A84_25645 [Frankia sp. CNm7]|uniref:Uncharacterized protein n=1 Tax=Frankia nepalensis TaxID=1836974 RepID=A0A937UV27_9ACTN|nr:hypothetical protein [Frankia nepalensis]MBL7502252.1 hypothetical protein [Frankia nepalensis]MBL7516041.1 hypothetical protein [Frankia nepalensis]MBL7521373.1 hypothetical protein [Frankia nepalensis]MBL7631816.1 hypothetical protein [Frankia nepalensis]